ncbi:antirestriction protein ArdA [Elizabethkingia occulta]|uniref:Antirestriction protein n=1 Tax=Elizabethkingia occulta TaxID=1867263 RepID=A0A1T3MTK2_9FLAO|nr:antirestriction protein ArdA [Elizabethkingia occulta]OPB91083.1 antirestriction protein [Elizabethkingia occulta]OPC67917.1 antirestriction protein [Elizabethkingia occulta]
MTKLLNCPDTTCIYVGTYKKYNEGSLFGKWLNLSDYSDYDELLEAMKELHQDETDPEFMFQDYECPSFINSLGLISESYISNDIYDIIGQISDSGYDMEVIESFIDCFGISDLNEVIDRINDCYIGEYSDDETFVQSLLEETGDIPQNIPSYICIDWESTARNVMYDYSTSNNHYFRSY